ncbi:hypothetical protein [Hyphococcus sp.]|uniref:hypothetical protein n=1 Tax=Hyphococcus sp. TaxID=2038636 RepID=UPI003D122B5A
MPIFSKRSTEDGLLRVGRVLTEENYKNIIGKLIKGGNAAIATEWEIALLDAFDRFGELRYEQALDDGACPDILFTDSWADAPDFIADIKTVFQDGLEAARTEDLFFQEVIRIAEAVGIDLKGLSFRVEEWVEGEDVRPAIPSRGEMPLFFNEKVRPWLRHYKAEGGRSWSRQFWDRRQGVNFHIAYDASQESFPYHFPRPKTKKRYQDHVVWRALSAARNQVKNSRTLIKGVMLTDGGCSYLRAEPHGWKNWNSELFTRFLKRYEDIQFLAVFSTRRRDRPLIFNRSDFPKNWDEVTAKVFALDETFQERMQAFFDKVCSEMPSVVLQPSAAERNSRPSWFWSARMDHIGDVLRGWSRDGWEEQRISAKALRGFLLGELPREALFDRNSGDPFAALSREGKRLEHVHLVKCPDQDDDIVKFVWADQRTDLGAGSICQKNAQRLIQKVIPNDTAE